ncbi:MAG TPA: hypothetical protein PL017_08625 [Tenuifilaceae bacterium]|mgnify:CR=1 FL=1|nr:hypothetical protein [Tenuifilaceae bacterium]HPE18995.1 hypothetical protein [Tenuifilaceae bacterium]HPJ46148.1 hypothetical protein [Tenuifilaceae bacterium]HPQ34698.1 hypothetical protein [Tenuifilaceae bacterium]HRX68126.1 hypothetical protein [Tenuifilaceae bacterium]
MDSTSGQNTTATRLQNPFPGLRPFHPKEAHLFFGREGQSDEILRNLSGNKFSAILGASGSGKSSLIYCGLLPILYGGFLHNGRSKWRIAISRPGSSPIQNLAQSIADAFAKSKDQKDIDADAFINQAVLRRSSDGISNVLNQYGVANDENILILVDQFEELFRYQYSGKEADALDKVDHFINLLVNIVKQQELPVYVVITMRSDFIGDCSPFQQFTRLINDSHYLIPRMTRDDFRKAITGPVAVGGGKISEQLVQLLLNEMGNNPDHLPILQHALMRTWDYWINHGDTNHPMGIVEYEAIGRLERALSNHANEAYDELSVEQKRVCEVVFKSLTEKGADNRGIRRPTSVKELAAIAESNSQEVINVAEVFRMRGRTFLTPAPHILLNEDSLIDISHESLMRVWDKLKVWVDDESSAVKMYLRLAESADMYSEGKTSLWGPPDLQLAINWREKQNPNLAWAVRYHPAFERTMVYLRTSEEEYIAEEENKIRLQKRAIRRSRIVALVLGTAGLIAIGLGILALIQRQDALKAQNEAVAAQKDAIKQKEEADVQRNIAQDKEKEALEQKELANKNFKEAEVARQNALRNLNEADRQRKIATQKSIEAQEQQKKAEENAQRALEEQKRAEQASLEAERRRMLSIAQSMAVKSQQLRVDTVLKGLLAYQGFVFNTEYEGTPYNPDVYKALYASVRYFKGSDFNVYKGHSSLVRTFLFQNGTLLSSGSDGKLLQWNLETKQNDTVMTNLQIVKKIIDLEGGIVGISNNGFFEFSLENKNLKEHSLSPLDIKDFFITEEGRFIMVFNQSISIADSYTQNGSEIYKSDVRINTTRYSKNLKTLFVALNDGKIIKISNPGSDNMEVKQLANIPESNWGEIAYFHERNLLAAGFGNFQGAVYLWNMKTGEQVNVLRGHNAKITGISFSSDGKYMATASYDGSVRLWHVDDLNTLPIVFDEHTSWVTSVAFTPDNKYIISGEKDGDIRKFPVDVNFLIEDYCQYLTRALTREEWNNYVGEDIEYKPKSCK